MRLLVGLDLVGEVSIAGGARRRLRPWFVFVEEKERGRESRGEQISEEGEQRRASGAFLSAPQRRGGAWRGGVREGGGGRGAGSRWEAEESCGRSLLLSSSKARREEHGGVELGDLQEGARRRSEHGSTAQRRAPSATGGQRRFYRTPPGILFTITNKSLLLFLLFLFETSRFRDFNWGT